MKTTTAHEAPDAAAAGQKSEHPLMTPVRAWDRFFFHPAEPTTLGLMRICAGLLVLYVHFIYTIDLMAYLGPDGWAMNKGWTNKPGEGGVYDYARGSGSVLQAPSWGWDESKGELVRGSAMWSIYYHTEDPKWVWTIHLTILVFMLLFTAGLWTRVTSVVTWIGALMYIQRLQSGMLFGLDTMTNLGLFYLMIAPCGAALSVDRWLKVRRERQRLGASYVPRPPEPMVSANFATRLVQINFCMIYFAAGTSKLLGTSWWNGTAPNRFLLNYSFAPFDVPAYVAILKWLADHRVLWELAGVGGVIGTLFVELGFPFLVWNRHMRWFMVCGSILFHTMIALSMGLVTFSIMMLILVLAFVPPEAVRQELHKLGEFFRLLVSPTARQEAKNRSLAMSR
jgi:hypothetical protein